MSALKQSYNESTTPSFMTLTRNAERRKHRRHDLAEQELPVYAVINGTPADAAMGRLLDLSSGGMKFETRSMAIQPNAKINVQLTLPAYAGLKPFVDQFDGERFATEWTGVLSVTRIEKQADGSITVAGRLLDMSEGERGLLGLYLSTQPLAA